MKSFIKYLSLVALVSLITSQASAWGLITTNTAAGSTTNLIRGTGGYNVYQIDITSSTANLVKVYDAPNAALTNLTAAYTGSTNITLSVTNLTTNGIFVYTGSTQYMIQTNIYVNANYRTNFAVAAAAYNYAPIAQIFVPAGVTASFVGDLQFINGIALSATNTCNVSIYTR